MAEPARNLYDDEEQGEGFYKRKPDLISVEGGGEGDGKPTGKLRSVDSANSNSDDSSGSSMYNPENRRLRDVSQDEAQSLPKRAVGRLSGISKKKKTIYGGLVGTLIGFATFLLPILSGPLQFLNIADILTRSLSALNLANEFRTGGIYRTLNYIGQNPERGRLGIVGNRVADNIERRLSADGIEVVKSAGGYMDGVRVNGQLIDLSDYDTNASRRSEFRRALRDNGYSRVATAIMSRPINYRYGIDFKPLGNVRRSAFDTFAAFRRAKIEEVNNKVANGSTNLSRVADTERQQQLAQLEAQKADLEQQKADLLAVDPNADTSAIDAQLADINARIAELSGAIPGYEDVKQAYDTTDGTHEQKLAAAKDSFISRSASGPFIVGAIALGVCFLESIKDGATTLEFVNIFLPTWRLAQDAVAIGAQIQSGEEVDLEELSVLSERFVDTEKNLSWDSAKTITYQNTGELKGEPAPLNVVPGAIQDDAWVQAGSFLSSLGIGNLDVDSICAFLGNPIVEVAGWVIEIAAAFFTAGASLTLSLGSIVLEEAIANFLLGPLGNSIISRIVGAEVVGMMAGSDYGNAVGVGGHIAANEAARSVSAFSLNKVQAAELQGVLNEREREIARSQSFVERYISLNNPRSMLASAMIDGSGSSPLALLREALNPTSTFSSSVATLNQSSMQTAYAQAGDGDLPLVYNYIPPIAYSVGDLQETVAADPFANQEYLIGKYGSDQALEDRYAPCNDPLPTIDEAYSDGGLEKDQYYTAVPQCDESIWLTEDFYRYRMYKLDIQNLLSIGCYSGDSASCDELGLAYHFEGNEPQEKIVAAIYSDQATEKVIAETRAINQICDTNPDNSVCRPEPSFATVFYSSLIRLMAKVTRPEFAS